MTIGVFMSNMNYIYVRNCQGIILKDSGAYLVKPNIGLHLTQIVSQEFLLRFKVNSYRWENSQMCTTVFMIFRGCGQRRGSLKFQNSRSARTTWQDPTISITTTTQTYRIAFSICLLRGTLKSFNNKREILD